AGGTDEIHSVTSFHGCACAQPAPVPTAAGGPGCGQAREWDTTPGEMGCAPCGQNRAAVAWSAQTIRVPVSSMRPSRAPRSVHQRTYVATETLSSGPGSGLPAWAIAAAASVSKPPDSPG